MDCDSTSIAIQYNDLLQFLFVILHHGKQFHYTLLKTVYQEPLFKKNKHHMTISHSEFYFDCIIAILHKSGKSNNM